jgi:hypothetical protein
LSDQYIQRLRSIRGEFEAARQGIAFINRNWQKYNIYNEISDVTPANFRQAEQYLLSTYLIRLFAEFEGTLKRHLNSNHPSIRVPNNPKVDWLISQVARAEEFKADTDLLNNMAKVRDYRNAFVHSGQPPAQTIDFSVALS